MSSVTWEELGQRAPGAFKPKPFYDPDCDSLTLFVADDESERERIDRYLTVYRSLKTGAIVGCHVKYVKKVLETVQAFHIGIETREMTFGLLLLGVPMAELRERAQPPKYESRVYQEVLSPLAKALGATRLPKMVATH
jgi:hypothetical protein